MYSVAPGNLHHTQPKRPGPGSSNTVALVGLLVISTLAAAVASSAWYARFGPAARDSAEALEVLQAVQERERTYLAATRSYASAFEDLGMPPPASQGWSYHILATRIDGRPLLLVEADDGTRHLAIDGFGRLYQGEVAPLPGT